MAVGVDETPQVRAAETRELLEDAVGRHALFGDGVELRLGGDGDRARDFSLFNRRWPC
jgi:hypothetical protein